jgi:hypothetical protein
MPASKQSLQDVEKRLKLKTQSKNFQISFTYILKDLPTNRANLLPPTC